MRTLSNGVVVCDRNDFFKTKAIEQGAVVVGLWGNNKWGVAYKNDRAICSCTNKEDAIEIACHYANSKPCVRRFGQGCRVCVHAVDGERSKAIKLCQGCGDEYKNWKEKESVNAK